MDAENSLQDFLTHLFRVESQIIAVVSNRDFLFVLGEYLTRNGGERTAATATVCWPTRRFVSDFCGSRFLVTWTLVSHGPRNRSKMQVGRGR